MNIKYRKLTENDIHILTELIRLYEAVFEMEHFSMPAAHHLQSLLENSQLIFYVALGGDAVAGGLTAYVLPSVYSATGDVYLYDLAVKRTHQRKGIGRQLLIELKNYCKQQGYREIFVQADVEDQYALDFYQATGGQPERVIHYTYVLNK